MTQDTLNLDLSKVAALQQKRTLAFVNHFVMTTVQFLNNFSKKCELKLMHFERKLEKVEAAMVLLETRLSSIPEVNTIQIDEPKSKEENVPVQSELKDSKLEPVDNQTEKMEESKENIESAPTKIPVEYERFLKMIQVGVPLQAVKLKVSLEGLDPDVLEQIINK